MRIACPLNKVEHIFLTSCLDGWAKCLGHSKHMTLHRWMGKVSGNSKYMTLHRWMGKVSGNSKYMTLHLCDQTLYRGHMKRGRSFLDKVVGTFIFWGLVSKFQLATHLQGKWMTSLIQKKKNGVYPVAALTLLLCANSTISRY